MKLRSRHLSVSVLVVTAVLVSACVVESPTATSAPTEAVTLAPQPTPVIAITAEPDLFDNQIEFWEQESDEVDVLLDQLVAQYVEAHPGIVVKRRHFGSLELRDQFELASNLGKAPALVRAPNDFAGPFAELGIVQPIDMIYDTAWLEQFYSGALKAATVRGVLYGVPDNYGYFLMLLYNRQLVSEVPADTNAWIQQLQTFGGDPVGRYGLVFNVNEPFWLVPWIGGFGGWPLDDNDQPALDTSATVQALHFVQDLRFKYNVILPDATYDQADAMFKEGKAAYLINGDWSLESYTQTVGLDAGTAVLPRVSQTGLYPIPMTAGEFWYFREGIAGQELEWARSFVEYMTSADVQAIWLKDYGRLPSNPVVASNPLIADNAILANAMAQLSRGRGIPAAPEMLCVWQAMRPPLEAVMEGKLTAEQAAAQMQEDALQCVSGG